MANAQAQGAGGGPVIDIAEVLDRQGINQFNILIIVIGWFAIFADGFDISNIGYVMPGLIKQWGVSPAAVGIVGSASLAAYPIGALLLGWVSDRKGRKLALIIGSLVVALFTFGTMFVSNVNELAVMRFLTGCGLGGLIPNIVALGSEFAPKRLRARLIIFSFCGINFGGFICGLVATPIINSMGWQGIFAVGGAVPLVAALLIWAYLPESVKFLALAGGRESELRKILVKLIPGHSIPENATFTVSKQTVRVPFRPGQLFNGALMWITPILWAMFILNFITLYFSGVWTNIILQNSGVPAGQAAVVSSLNQGGGVLGGLVISYFVDKFGFLPVIAMGILTAATVWAIGMPGLDIAWVAVWVTVSGFGMQGLQYCLNATPGMIYPTSFRAFGAGWAFSVSRLGAVAGPIIGGSLAGYYASQHLDKATTAQQMFLFPVYPLVIGIVLAVIASALAKRAYHGYQFDETEVKAEPATGH